MVMFRKKPLEVEALQWDGSSEGALTIMEWVCGVVGRDDAAIFLPSLKPGESAAIKLRSIGGDILYAKKGDWIVLRPPRDFFPCDPDTFARMYEPSA